MEDVVLDLDTPELWVMIIFPKETPPYIYSLSCTCFIVSVFVCAFDLW